MYFECRSMQYSDNDGCEGFVLWNEKCNAMFCLKDTLWFKNSSEFIVWLSALQSQYTVFQQLNHLLQYENNN